MTHELTKSILISHIVELIAVKYKVSIEEARDRLYHTPVIKFIEDDETDLYGESPLYCLSLYEPYARIEKLTLKDLMPSQLYISEKKLDEVNKWMGDLKEESYEPIPIAFLDDEIIMTDGHTRAVAAIKKGLTKYPLIWDADELDWDLYRECVKECKKQGINSSYDLVDRVISEEEYNEKWNKWCDNLHERIDMERKAQTPKLKLIKLTKEYEKELGEMIDEWKVDQEVNHTNHSPWAIFKNDYHDFDYYLSHLDDKGDEPGKVPSSTFFLLDTNRNRLLGACNIRHYLNEGLLLHGGHIGDGVRPSERGKGYATKMIGLALIECKKLGIDKVLMVCDKDNIASQKSIISNGGILENEIYNDDKTRIEQRYWINL